MTRDYYDILEIPRSASETDIKKAFRQLAKKHHPDINISSDAETKMKEILEAYQVLSNSDLKKIYDSKFKLDNDKFEGVQSQWKSTAEESYSKYRTFDFDTYFRLATKRIKYAVHKFINTVTLIFLTLLSIVLTSITVEKFLKLFQSNNFDEDFLVVIILASLTTILVLFTRRNHRLYQQYYSDK